MTEVNVHLATGKGLAKLMGLKKELNFKFFSEIFRGSLKTSEIKEEKKVYLASPRKKEAVVESEFLSLFVRQKGLYRLVQ